MEEKISEIEKQPSNNNCDFNKNNINFFNKMLNDESVKPKLQ